MKQYFKGFMHIAFTIPIVWLVFILVGAATNQSIFEFLTDNSFASIICYTLIVIAINIIKIIVHKIRVRSFVKNVEYLAKISGMKITDIDKDKLRAEMCHE